MEKKQSCMISTVVIALFCWCADCGQLKLLSILTSNAELQAGKQEMLKGSSRGFTDSDGPAMAHRRMRNPHVHL
jgi:hypothetical protein